MFEILQYVAIASALIGVIFLSMFCISIIGRNKRKILRNLICSLIFIGIFAGYVFAAITFKWSFF